MQAEKLQRLHHKIKTPAQFPDQPAVKEVDGSEQTYASLRSASKFKICHQDATDLADQVKVSEVTEAIGRNTSTVERGCTQEDFVTPCPAVLLHPSPGPECSW